MSVQLCRSAKTALGLVVIIFFFCRPAFADSQEGSSLHEHPESFGLGTSPTEAELAALDTDIRPDGKGLPKGQGSAREGKSIYELKCQQCHGLEGEGGINDKLVGTLKDGIFPFAEKDAPKKTIGNYWPYATTLFDYIRRTMPYTQPGSLTDDETYSLTAYLLYLNKIIPEDRVLNSDTLPAITMPAHHRFKNDNRTRSGQVL
ncbi:c-type cytochrome [Endozoicomonas numazuensis]|uniref:c-type cytochrome n=1 Tax=Endozoicomonas numazuensis TaxID=1137799 RepID=UPI0009DD4562|nr:cytochrome c [Endozoicomonas numazuensis]